MTEGRAWLRCLEPFVDADTGDRRRPGDEWETDPVRADALDSGPLAVALDGPGGSPVGLDDPWERTDGRDLRTVVEPESGAAVVACLNIWDDLPALKETLHTWYPHVNRVIAVDGAYAGAPARTCASTDGTVEFLRDLDRTELVPAPDPGFWPDQVAKRNAYLERLRPGEVAFVIDADEFVTDGHLLRHLPPLDVGWVPYRKGIYRKPQNFPRLLSADVRPRYRGRHYWIDGDRGALTDCQTGAAGYEHAFVPVQIDNTRGPDLRSSGRIRADRIARAHQISREAEAGAAPQSGRESLRIAQVAYLDAGMVVFRLHTAINSTSPHTSTMATPNNGRPYAEPFQYDLHADRRLLRRYLGECDVVHCHLGYQAWDALGVHTDAPVVIHHHGTMYRSNPGACNRRDGIRADVRLVSNPELLKYGDDLHYLPNPVPVERYRRLRTRLYRPDPDGWFRIGHSPSKRELKGTVEFLDVVESLRRSGLRVRPVLIEDVAHAECLRRKAVECDAFFDSFWLGMQCSGIEAAAMGVPVVAGDPDCRSWYETAHGDTPYAYANDAATLRRAIEMLATDWEYRQRVRTHGHDHVTRVHDYAAVVARYLDVLDDQLEWRRRLTLGSGATFLRRSD